MRAHLLLLVLSGRHEIGDEHRCEGSEAQRNQTGTSQLQQAEGEFVTLITTLLLSARTNEWQAKCCVCGKRSHVSGRVVILSRLVVRPTLRTIRAICSFCATTSRFTPSRCSRTSKTSPTTWVSVVCVHSLSRSTSNGLPISVHE